MPPEEREPASLASSKVNDRYLNEAQLKGKISELRLLARNACRREQEAKDRLRKLLAGAVDIGEEDHRDLSEAFGVVDRENVRADAAFSFPDDDMRLLWESQRQYICTEDKRSFRWHPR